MSDGNNHPQYEVSCQNELQYFYAEQISALILDKVKNDAESQLQQPIKNVVITHKIRITYIFENLT